MVEPRSVSITVGSICLISMGNITPGDEVYRCQQCFSLFASESINHYFMEAGIGCPHCSAPIENLVKGLAVIVDSPSKQSDVH